LESEQRAVAGRNATKQLNKHTKRQQELNEKEAWLTAKEMQLNRKSGAGQREQGIEGIIGGLYEVGSIQISIAHSLLMRFR
jgi:hypothetical protein